MNYEDIPELNTRTERASRNLELFQETQFIEHKDIEPICFAIIEHDLNLGIMRTDRAKPTDDRWIDYIIHMNESDEIWIEKLMAYKAKNEILLKDRIPLMEYQQAWVDYILCDSEVKPSLPIIERKSELQEVPC